MIEIISNLDQEYLISQMPDLPRVKSGLKTIDEICDDFAMGELVVLSGCPKHGKSLLVKTMMKNMYHSGNITMLFSYEETPRELYTKFPNRSRDILFYVPSKLETKNVKWLEEAIDKAMNDLGVKIFFIDHGQKLGMLSNHHSGAEVWGDMAQDIKEIARSKEIIVFLVWHLAKNTVRREEDLTGDLLRDTGMLLGELDTLLMNFREVKTSDGIVQAETYSSIVVERTRRTGEMMKTVPVVKRGYYLEEIGGVPCQ